MLETGQNPALALEPALKLEVPTSAGANQFQGHQAIEPLVLVASEVDGAHAARAQMTLDPIGTDGAAGQVTGQLGGQQQRRRLLEEAARQEVRLEQGL